MARDLETWGLPQGVTPDKATQKSVTLLVSSPLMEMADYFLGGVGIGVGPGALPWNTAQEWNNWIQIAFPTIQWWAVCEALESGRKRVLFWRWCHKSLVRVTGCFSDQTHGLSNPKFKLFGLSNPKLRWLCIVTMLHWLPVHVVGNGNRTLWMQTKIGRSLWGCFAFFFNYTPSLHVWNISLHLAFIWWYMMVHVGKHSIHGSYGIRDGSLMLFTDSWWR